MNSLCVNRRTFAEDRKKADREIYRGITKDKTVEENMNLTEVIMLQSLVILLEQIYLTLINLL